MIVNAIGLLNTTHGAKPVKFGVSSLIPSFLVRSHDTVSAVATTNLSPATDVFTRTGIARQENDELTRYPGMGNKETASEPFAALGKGLDAVMDQLYDQSDPHQKGSLYFLHAPSVGEKRKRLFIYTNGSQPLTIQNGAIETALGKAGILPAGQHIKKLTLSTGYQENKATGGFASRQMGGFGPFHIMFRHGQPVYETEPTDLVQTLRPEYRESVSRFFDAKDNSFATPKQIGQWIGDTLTKGQVVGIEKSDWDHQLRLVTLTHPFNHGVGRRVEPERGELRYVRNWQGPIELKTVKVVVGYHPKHPNELYLYTAYPTH